MEKPSPHIEKVAYTIDESAVCLGVSRNVIYNEMNEERLLSFWAGGRRLISRKALNDYVYEREQEELETRKCVDTEFLCSDVKKKD